MTLYYDIGDFVAECYKDEVIWLKSESNAPAVYGKISGEGRRVLGSLNDWM